MSLALVRQYGAQQRSLLAQIYAVHGASIGYQVARRYVRETADLVADAHSRRDAFELLARAEDALLAGRPFEDVDMPAAFGKRAALPAPPRIDDIVPEPSADPVPAAEVDGIQGAGFRDFDSEIEARVVEKAKAYAAKGEPRRWPAWVIWAHGLVVGVGCTLLTLGQVVR